MQKVARIGVSNASVLDLSTGNISGNSGTVVLDKSILDQIAFIQEGKFVESGGTPTLRIIGETKDISTEKVVMAETTQKVVRAIEPSDIVLTFLKKDIVDDPLEYVKRVCSATSANYPMYFFLQQASKSVTDAITIITDIPSRGTVKKQLLERLEGKIIPQKNMPRLSSTAAKSKDRYMNLWISESIPQKIDELAYCVEAIFFLSDEDIKCHEQYICNTLQQIFIEHYEGANSNIASYIRKAICRIDEALYFE